MNTETYTNEITSGLIRIRHYFSGQILRVSLSMSENAGFAPQKRAAFALETKVIGEVIT